MIAHNDNGATGVSLTGPISETAGGALKLGTAFETRSTITLPDDVAAPARLAGFAGAEVSYRFLRKDDAGEKASEEVTLRDLETAFEQAGISASTLPELPSPKVAFRRAVASLRDKHTLIRTLKIEGDSATLSAIAKKPKKAATRKLLCVVDETERSVAEELEYSTSVKYELREVAPKDWLPVADPDDHWSVQDVRGAYHHFRSVLIYSDVTAWLIGLIVDRRGVATLEDGRNYFVPPSGVDRLDRIAAAVSAGTGGRYKLYARPAFKNSSAVLEMVADAITLETEKAVRLVEAKLMQGLGEEALARGEKPLGKRALETQANELSTNAERLREFESVLGRKLSGVRSKLEAVKAQMTIASLSAADSAEED